MTDLPPITDLIGIGRALGVVGTFAYVLMWLLRRGDGLQRENIKQLIRQRDHYRDRYEQSESDRDKWKRRAELAESELAARMALDTGEIPKVLRERLEE